MTGKTSIAKRVLERRRAVALARHYREFEGLSIAQIADRLGRSPATIKAYFYDPTGEKARAVKARYVGLCLGCAADRGAFDRDLQPRRLPRARSPLPRSEPAALRDRHSQPAALPAGAGVGRAVGHVA